MRKTIDEACRYWVKHGAWSMMDPEASLFVWDRVWEGYMFAAWIYTRGFRHSGKTESELLDFLLVENWEGMGVYNSRARNSASVNG